MNYICYAETMREADRRASEEGGVPSIVLMENAAAACVDELYASFPDLVKKRVAVIAGKGNNGGDGFCIARHLYNAGVDVTVFLAAGNVFHGDALINFEIIRKMEVNIVNIDDPDTLDCILPAYDIVVDAIYGTGIHGTVRGISYDVIEKINEYANYVLAVDIPSGINSDTGEICGVCVKADKTVTFAAYKMAMALFPGCDCMGKVVVRDISIPRYILDDMNIPSRVIDSESAAIMLPRRAEDSHKGDYGKVFVIAGSRGMTGAAAMACEAALYSGAGLVTLGIPESLNDIMEVKLTEVMTLPLPEEDGHLSADAFEAVSRQAENSDVILFGPGLGRSEGVFRLCEQLLKTSKIPVILDADGLNVISEHLSVLEDSGCDLILTPHEAEMSRLTGMSIDYVRDNRLLVSAEFAREYGATVILKGHHTVVTSPDERQYINMTGNAGMATGGSGDVLAGMTAALLAQGIPQTEAAALAVYFHGAAGDKCMEKYGIHGVTPTRMLELLRL